MLPHPLSLKKLSVFLLVQLIANLAAAQVYNSSISAATGGTGRATVEAGDSTFLNPASQVHLRGHYFFASGAEDEFAITLSDNTEESMFPATLGYVQRTTDVAQGELKQSDIMLSLAEFIVDKWAFGITGHYIEQKLPDSSYRQPNADIGIMYTPKSYIGWGLVVYNVFGENKDAPENIRQKTSVGGGFNYIYKEAMRFRVDATSESVFGAGLETYVNRFLITRIGYSNDTDDERELLTAGFGFKGPRFALSYAYQGNQKFSGDYRHSVDLEIPF
ncbi:hypothetical protein AZI87_06385 [Bdellovibrio bacteriovorus]|uniref:Transporter n=1 Tax=Bdellovibrio bacteriovorus TaxID=959 RepID=A0A161PQF6_BDEBC|nr:hypothetical protein [Bdellovibrio bacteriovorus]KYG68853.1 hypothetical protein AZI87_06385 [Bdellovibrio bacteriovorus]